jgi:intermediate peptidase
MQGLSRIFQRLYGIRLVPRPTQPGETWNDDVRRLDVVDEDDGHIAVMYCDLFERRGKNPNPAHFTVRCSRNIPEEEIAESTSEGSLFASAEDAANDGMATVRDQNGKLYQVPTIVLICDFARGPSNRPTLLSFREVQTLFHEMGHAVHSMLGRTDLQNVSGTRCATDFAELPSVLMENFASDPGALALFARHWETNAPLPFEMVQEKIDLNMRFEGLDTESQIILAKLDQAYHSPAAFEPGFDTTSVYHSVYKDYCSLREPPGTKWQGFFGHLFGYGATYYSYLFDRAISGKIWREVFKKSPTGSVSREAGSLFRSEVLEWGGGRDPWKCVAGVLKDSSLEEGGTRAMEEVGRWGVKGTS